MSSGDSPRDRSIDTISASYRSSGDAGEHPVSGVVNRVKVPNANIREVVVNDPSIDSVMLSIESARRLVDLRKETARTYFREDQTVITTTTTHDNILRELSWRDELDIIRQFSPDYHIPTEYSVYDTMSSSEQRTAIKDCMEGTEWMAKRLENHTTSVLLQAKGWRPWHYELCRETMNRLQTGFLVFYAAGYEGRVYEPKEHLENLISVLDPSGVFIIGKQSPRFLSKVPPKIVAAAGRRWRRKSRLEDGSHSPLKHISWKAGVEEDLGTGQTMLSSYASTTVKENG